MICTVTDIRIPELEIYASMNEVHLKRIYEPQPGLFIAETANVILRAMDAGYEAVSLLLEDRYLKAEEKDNEVIKQLKLQVAEIIRRAGDVTVYTASLDQISQISGFKQSRGILCAMRRRKLPELSEVLQGAKRIAILEDVENPTNVGAIFRSAAALGMDAVLLTYGSTDPLYRRSARVSMGGVFMVPWTFVGNKYGGWPDPILQKIRNAGFRTVSMALSNRAVFLDDPVLQQEEKLAVILGNEENGLVPATLEQSDYIVKIPMMHGMDSLNVAAASAVTFWELRNR